jgi:hypothetical protein
MNDLTSLFLFLEQTGTEYFTFTDPQFIDEESVKLGAIIAISIRGSAHFNFDSSGRLIGSSTDAIKSHMKRKIK